MKSDPLDPIKSNSLIWMEKYYFSKRLGYEWGLNFLQVDTN